MKRVKELGEEKPRLSLYQGLFLLRFLGSHSSFSSLPPIKENCSDLHGPDSLPYSFLHSVPFRFLSSFPAVFGAFSPSFREREEEERDFFFHPSSARLTFRPARSTQFSASPGFIKSLSSSHSERGPFRYFVVGLFLFRFFSRADLLHIAVSFSGSLQFPPKPSLPISRWGRKGVKVEHAGWNWFPQCSTVSHKSGGKGEGTCDNVVPWRSGFISYYVPRSDLSHFFAEPSESLRAGECGEGGGRSADGSCEQEKTTTRLLLTSVRLNFAPGSHGDLEERPSRCDSVMRTRLKIK